MSGVARIRLDDPYEWIEGILYLTFAPDGRCRELRETWHWIEGRHEPLSGWGE
jgi:hypothetical protein